MQQPVQILIADDNQLLLAITGDALSAAGFEVHTVDSGLDVYKEVLAKKPQLILLDIMMPGMDGIEICKNLKRSPVTSKIVIVIHSSKTDMALMDLCYEYGADRFIIKSDKIEDLVTGIKDILQEKLGAATAPKTK